MKLALIFAAMLLIGAPMSGGSLVQAQKVSVNYDKAAPFPTYKTFMFPTTGGGRNPLINEMIIAAAERELTAKGLTRVTENADLIVSHLAASGISLQTSQVNFGYNVSPVYAGLVPASGPGAAWDIVTGTLLMDIYDKKTDRIIFRGTAKDVLQRAPSADMVADAKLVSKVVNKAVTKILKKYPTTR